MTQTPIEHVMILNFKKTHIVLAEMPSKTVFSQIVDILTSMQLSLKR